MPEKKPPRYPWSSQGAKDPKPVVEDKPKPRARAKPAPKPEPEPKTAPPAPTPPPVQPPAKDDGVERLNKAVEGILCILNTMPKPQESIRRLVRIEQEWKGGG